MAAWFLWKTRVPGDLRLPHVEPARYFSEHDLHRAARYERFGRLDCGIGTVVELAVLAVLALLGPRIASGFALGRVGTGVMVGAVATLMLWLVGLPFGFGELWWNRRYGLSRRGYGEWLLEQWPSLLGQVVGLTILLTILMLLAGWLRRYWWLVAGPLLVVIGAALVFVLAYFARVGTHPIRNDAVAADVRQLAGIEGVPKTTVRVEKVSDDTRAVNAEATGFGPSTTVVLWDTLFDGRFSRRAIDVVAAHELGHVARHHIWKGIAWSALLTTPLMFLVAAATRRRGGMHRPEVVPFALLVIAALSVLITPLENVISRRYEAEADWMALQATRDPSGARELFRRFGSVDLEQPNPPGWDYVLLENHPTLAQRLAMVEAWRERAAASAR